MKKISVDFIIKKIESFPIKVLSKIKGLGDKHVKCLCTKHNEIFYYNWIPRLMIGKGCPICKKENVLRSKKAIKDKTWKKLLSQYKKIHKNKYNYSKSIYKRADVNIKVYCNKCKKYFYTRPWNHYYGSGCPYCVSLYLTKKERIEKIKDKTLKILKYDEIGKDHLTTAKCLLCGTIFTRKYNSFINGYKCPVCCKGRMYSRKAVDCIETISKKVNLVFETMLTHGKEHYIKDIKGHVDGYNSFYKIIIEFQGDRWHGNPKIFKSYEKCHPIDKNITAGELYKNTKKRINKLKRLGYHVIEIWESSMEKDIEKAIKKINQWRKNDK